MSSNLGADFDKEYAQDCYDGVDDVELPAKNSLAREAVRRGNGEARRHFASPAQQLRRQTQRDTRDRHA
jgi:hypothetical protein